MILEEKLSAPTYGRDTRGIVNFLFYCYYDEMNPSDQPVPILVSQVNFEGVEAKNDFCRGNTVKIFMNLAYRVKID